MTELITDQRMITKQIDWLIDFDALISIYICTAANKRKEKRDQGRQKESAKMTGG